MTKYKVLQIIKRHKINVSFIS